MDETLKNGQIERQRRINDVVQWNVVFCSLLSVSGRFEEKNGEFVQVKVDKVRRLMSHVRAETLANDAMPAGSEFEIN